MAVSLNKIQNKYNTQRKCIELLESIRWPEKVVCPYCDKSDNHKNKGELGRYGCNNCGRSFSVLVDTIFEDTRLPLKKWFQIIVMMLNSKSGMAAKEIERNMDITYKTAYYVAMRVRIGMLVPDTKLNGIIEMDESYFGGKARKQNKRVKPDIPTLAVVTRKRGRGTNKISVAGMVQRKGNVKSKVIEKLSKRNLLKMLKEYAKKENTILVTDGFRGYKKLEEYVDRLEVEHKKQFSKGIVHVNTIESFWSYVKNGIRGSYKAISPKYLPFYLIEYEWKWNHRNFRGDEFKEFLKNALGQEKELEYWKAKDKEEVKELAYG